MRQGSVIELNIFTHPQPIFWKQVVFFFLPHQDTIKEEVSRFFSWDSIISCLSRHTMKSNLNSTYALSRWPEHRNVTCGLRTMHIINSPWAYSFPQVPPPHPHSSLPAEGTPPSCTVLKIQSVVKSAGVKSPWNKYSQMSDTPNYDRNLISLLHSHPYSTLSPEAKKS